jgi:tetraacyldisaccharide 4'-kinase
MLTGAQFQELVSGRWEGPLAGGLRGVLGIGEYPYRWIVSRRNARFDHGISRIERVEAPVVSVGNLTVGGTGKTPMVAWLARWFLEHGAQVTLISRGYGARRGKPNDEALELAARLPGVPHLQNPDRVTAAREAVAANPRQVLVLDDAFQHRRLARDLDIVLLDALAPFGYDRLLPRGLLREHVEGLSRADVVALSRSDCLRAEERSAIEARVRQLAPRAAWLELNYRPCGFVTAAGEAIPLAAVQGQRIAAFCGIGNPAGFWLTLEANGLMACSILALSDHCPYGERELARIRRWLSQLPAQHVICTRKDLVKIPHAELAGKRLLALDIALEITSGQAKLEALLTPLAASIAAPQTAPKKNGSELLPG